MTSFKVRKISPKQRKIKSKSLRTMSDFFGPKKLLVIAIFVSFFALVWAGAAFLNSDFLKDKTRELLSTDNLPQDEFGHTNILFLGVGGKMEQGGLLSDSVMIVSLDPKGPSASVLSLPRDLFVSSEVGDRKLNEIYAAARHKYGDEEGLNVVERAVGNFAGIEIHHAVVIDFEVFVELIDWAGGFEIYVPEAIEDPFYPDVNYGYQTFVVRKGLQRFDGEMALKYARSRKTSSDYSRAKRQQDILFAFRKELAKEGRMVQLLQDTTGIKALYDSYKERINMDIPFQSMMALARLIVGIDTNMITTAVINDDPRQKGGLLYTPEKEFFGGQFVLIPEDLEDTQIFIRMNLLNPSILKENTQIAVLNGSQIEGKASENGARLRRIGFHVIDTGNYEAPNGKPVSQTFIKNFKPGENEQTIRLLKEMYNISEILDVPEEVTPETIEDIELIIGYN